MGFKLSIRRPAIVALSMMHVNGNWKPLNENDAERLVPYPS